MYGDQRILKQRGPEEVTTHVTKEVDAASSRRSTFELEHISAYAIGHPAGAGYMWAACFA